MCMRVKSICVKMQSTYISIPVVESKSDECVNVLYQIITNASTCHNKPPYIFPPILSPSCMLSHKATPSFLDVCHNLVCHNFCQHNSPLFQHQLQRDAHKQKRKELISPKEI